MCPPRHLLTPRTTSYHNFFFLSFLLCFPSFLLVPSYVHFVNYYGITLCRSQPMYVIQECDAKLSMYSQWKTRPCDADSSPLGVAGPVDAMSLYDSRQRSADTCIARSREQRRMVLTHSSYWTNRDRPTSSSANQKPAALSPDPAPANPNWVRSISPNQFQLIPIKLDQN